MTEPYTQIGNHVLTEAQAIAVRVAVTFFHQETGEPSAAEAMGPIAEAYHARLGEVLTVMLAQDRREKAR